VSYLIVNGFDERIVKIGSNLDRSLIIADDAGSTP
jgi:hypothetical protein